MSLTSIRIAGAAMAAGAVLLFARMIPIFANLPPELAAFPPEGAEQLAILARGVGSLWLLAHILGLGALALMLASFLIHARALQSGGKRLTGALLAVVATAGFGPFMIAMAIDGFAVPAAVADFDAGSGSLGQIELAHAQALDFFVWGNALIFLAIVLLSQALLHGYLSHKLWGGVGLVLSVLALSAFAAGWTGDGWSGRFGMLSLLLAMVWMAVCGLLVALRGSKPPVSASDAPAGR